MPGAQCTRSLVRARGSQVCARVFTAEAPETSGIPHAMVLRLIRDLPGDEFLLPPSPRGLNGFTCPVGSTKPPRGLASATDARTTRLRRTLQRRSSCAFADRSQAFTHPATPFRARRCRVHRIPCPTFVTIREAPLLRDGMRE